ncbi:MAG: mechanosensitive ion channel family protein [Bdellovibrionaceae bacterium]|nr:mechanosensitive ion channel family protein [Bdellovibrionales bacterium]MCB9253164.1 mechanosensitive ion channel family protein [Pseudobdellovibrionaceae bacterium]
MTKWINDGYELLKQEMVEWFEGVVKALPNLVVAVFLSVLFWYAAGLASRMLERAFRRFVDSETLVSLLTRTARFVLLCVGLFFVLGVLNLEKTVASLLAGAGVLGLVVGIAFQDFMSNFFAGIMISFRRPFVVGDIIESNSHMGTVKNVNLRNTVVLNFDGQQVLIPNKIVIENPLLNYTRYKRRRVNLAIGVSYATDLEQAANIAKEAVGALQGVLSDPKPEVDYQEFGDSSINFALRFWIDYPQTNFFRIQSDAVVAVKKAFDKNDITIPFPIRTLDFGIEGGKTLAEMLKLKN